MTRTIDPEHNWVWIRGYRDGFDRREHIGPEHSHYFDGYEAGAKDRAARDDDKRQECPGCGGTNTRRLTKNEHECFDCRETW